MLGGLKKTVYTGPRDPTETESDLPLSVWVPSAEAQAISNLLRGQVSGCNRPERHGVWAPPLSRQADDPLTGEQVYQRSSHTGTRVLGPITDFPTWGSRKGNENPQGFDFGGQWDLQNFHRTGETDSWGHRPNLVHTRTQKKEAVTPQDWARLDCECPGVSCRGVGPQWPASGSGRLNTTVLA